MYTFKDILIDTSASSSSLPVDDMTINGISLSTVGGYRQLYVEGRGMISQDINTTTIPGKSGVFVNNTRTKEREITVFYKLTASTSQDLRDKFSELNKRLRGNETSNELTIRFADELSYSYVAYFSDSEKISENSLEIVSSFSLLIPDPYKKLDQQTSTGRIVLSQAFEVSPNEITATVSVTGTSLTVTNGRNTIQLIGNYVAGKPVIITWLEDEITIIYNNSSILYQLATMSVPEDFKLRNGDIITGTNLVISSVSWRDERL